MFHINSVTDSAGAGFQIFGGFGSDQKVRAAGDRLGPQGATYVLSVDGAGLLLLTDVGNTVNPARWEVQINGAEDWWFYTGEGQATVAFAADGTVAIAGGSGTATAVALRDLTDMTSVFPYMFAMISQSATLSSQWNQDPLASLATLGLSGSWKLNVADDYVTQMRTVLLATKVSGPATPIQLQRLSLVGPVAVLAATAFGALSMKPNFSTFEKWIETLPAAQHVATIGAINIGRVAEILESCYFSDTYTVGAIIILIAP